MATVRSGLTFTMNMGDFQSVRITAEFEDTVHEGETEIEAFERAEQLVDDRMRVNARRIRKQFGMDDD